MFSHLARREVTCRSHATKGSSNSSKASSNLPRARLEVASIFFQKDQQHLKAWQRAVWRVEDQPFSRSPTEHHSGHSTLGFHSLTLSCLFIDLPTFGPLLTSPAPQQHWHQRQACALLHHVPTIAIIGVSRPCCFASSPSSIISPISSFPQPCALQQTSPTTPDELDKLAFFNKRICSHT